MLKITHEEKPDPAFPYLDLLTGESFLFDIETTGLSREKNMIYLIGAAWRKDGKIHIVQFFAEDGAADEQKLLEAFFEFCSHFKQCITYNGAAFDVPFVQNRALRYCSGGSGTAPDGGFDANPGDEAAALNGSAAAPNGGSINSLDRCGHLDIYREIRRLGALLPLTDYRQKTVEQFLGVRREDRYSGGELRSIYFKFLKTRDETLKQLLLLHNYEDVCGMLPLLGVLNYSQVLTANYRISSFYTHQYRKLDRTDAWELLLEADLPKPVPARLTLQNGFLTCKLDGQSLKAAIPLEAGTRKLFFKDYKNYYYLPVEDQAIHKSVACFADGSHREKATAANCYQKHEGLFLRCPEPMLHQKAGAAFPPEAVKLLQSRFPVFKEDYKDKKGYLLWKEPENDSQKEDVKQLLKMYISAFLAKST